MADVLGAVASAVQLADVALRSSLQIYEFLSGIRNATEDVQALRHALHDVDSNMRTLRAYLIEFKKSKSAIQDHETLPEIMTDCLLKFHDDIQTLRNLLPREHTPRAASRLKWVFDKRKIKDITARLNDRKLSLVTALATTGLKHNLRLREDSADIAQRQVTTHATVIDRLYNVHKAQEQTDIRLLQLQTITQDQLSQQHNVLNSNISDRFSSIESKLEASLTQTQKVSTAVQASMHKIYTTTRFSGSRSESATQVLRTQLMSEFRSMLDQVTARSESQFEAIRHRLESVAEQIARESAQRAKHEPNIDTPNEVERLTGACSQDRFISIGQNIAEREMSRLKLKTVTCEPFLQSDSHWTTTTYHQSWAGEGRLGFLRVEIETISKRFEGSPGADTAFAISIHFWPCQDLIRVRGISVSWSTAPDQRGFYQIGPSIVTFPIIPVKLIEQVMNGGLCKLQQMLANKEIHLRTQTPDGGTLLHCAAGKGMPDICSFLTSHGLSWDQTDHYDHTPMHTALQLSVLSTRNSSYESLFQLFRGFGVSLDDLASRLTDSYSLDIDFANEETTFEDISRYLLKNSDNGWEYLFRWLVGWAHPTRWASKIMESALQHGLNPNLELGPSGSLLRYALRAIPLITRRAVSRPQRSKNVQNLETWRIISTLIQGGANIHLVDAGYLERATTWRNIITPWAWAIQLEVDFEWASALRECGLDPDEVWYEDTQIRKQAIRLRGAKRTGMDEEVLRLPSVAGLRYRRYTWPG